MTLTPSALAIPTTIDKLFLAAGIDLCPLSTLSKPTNDEIGKKLLASTLIYKNTLYSLGKSQLKLRQYCSLDSSNFSSVVLYRGETHDP